MEDLASSEGDESLKIECSNRNKVHSKDYCSDFALMEEIKFEDD